MASAASRHQGLVRPAVLCAPSRRMPRHRRRPRARRHRRCRRGRRAPPARSPSTRRRRTSTWPRARPAAAGSGGCTGPSDHGIRRRGNQDLTTARASTTHRGARADGDGRRRVLRARRRQRSARLRQPGDALRARAHPPSRRRLQPQQGRPLRSPSSARSSTSPTAGRSPTRSPRPAAAVWPCRSPASRSTPASAPSRPTRRATAVYAGTATRPRRRGALVLQRGVFGAATYVGGYTNITALGVGPLGALYIVQDPNGALSPSVDSTAGRTSTPGLSARCAAGRHVRPAAGRHEEGPSAFAFERRQRLGRDALPVQARRRRAELPRRPVDGQRHARGACRGRAPLKGRGTDDAPEADGTSGAPPPCVSSRWTRPRRRDDRHAVVDTVDTGGACASSRPRRAGVGFTCALDDLGAPAPCGPPKDYALDPGEHRITVRPTDAAATRARRSRGT